MKPTTAEAADRLRRLERDITKGVASRVGRLAAGLFGGAVGAMVVAFVVLFAFGGNSPDKSQASNNRNTAIGSLLFQGSSTWRDATKTIHVGEVRGGTYGLAASGASFRAEALGSAIWSLKLEFPNPAKSDEFDVTSVCRKVDGDRYETTKVRMRIEGGQRSATINNAISTGTNSVWAPGKYRIELMIDGHLIGQTEFYVYADIAGPEAKRQQPSRPGVRPAERVNRANKAASERALDQ